MSNLLLSTINYLKEANQHPSLYTMDPIIEREKREIALKSKRKHHSKNVTRNEYLIPVRDGSYIKTRSYIPKGKGPFPIIIYYHGGGWVLNSIETCDESCMLLAEITKSVVLSINYRLAPEHKFPIPVYDAYDAFLWTANNRHILKGGDAILVAGDSAGGNLATVVTLLNRDLQGPEIQGQILLYPVTDLTFNTPSYEEFAVGYGLLKEDMAWFRNHYIKQEAEIYHPYTSPLQAENLSHLPPALIVVAENDVLRDEGILYAKKLRDFGGNVELTIARGLVHSFFTKNEFFHQEIQDTIFQIRTFLSAYISKGKKSAS